MSFVGDVFESAPRDIDPIRMEETPRQAREPLSELFGQAEPLESDTRKGNDLGMRTDSADAYAALDDVLKHADAATDGENGTYFARNDTTIRIYQFCNL